MNASKQGIEILSVRELLSDCQYTVPIYQRNYAWGDEEIEALIQDIQQAQTNAGQNHHYYLGSLVVLKKEQGVFEVIDGQQRLTTLNILQAYLMRTSVEDFQVNIGFEHRQDSDMALQNLFNPQFELPYYFQDAIKAIEKHWPVDEEEGESLAAFLYDQVHIIRTEVPPETDLNHYFEIMNTRGEQLEKHEVLKARLISRLKFLKCNEHEQAVFAQIWDAASDMQRYVILGFPASIRKALFGKRYQNIPHNFDEMMRCQTLNLPKNTAKAEQNNSILGILERGQEVAADADSQTSERFGSVIDFSNFLMHVLRIFNENHAKLSQNHRTVHLDDKNLLSHFKALESKQISAADIKRFAMVLLQCRCLFDQFVIKTDSTNAQEGHWALQNLNPGSRSESAYQYHNTFQQKNHQIVLLLSMFHVSHPSRLYKNWLYAVLRWLFEQQDLGFEDDDYIEFLEDLSDRYYFGHYAKGMDFFDLIVDESSVQSIEQMPRRLKNILNSGTAVPNFIFNRLDYLLWKKSAVKRQNKAQFSFTFRTSVEHFYPQHPIDGKQPPKNLHHFGNLCLVSRSMNSRFGNNMPEAKKVNFGTMENQSLKLQLMMAQAKNWNQEKIQHHAESMLQLLNQRCCDIEKHTDF